ncbi:MAG TPA: signal peptide peptidase SppA [Aliidongia sp.]|nr:signal peptide peptidase SppA [Aliidongia sp.]
MRVILWIFAVIGFLSVVLFGFLTYAALHLRVTSAPTPIAENTVLQIDFDRPIVEGALPIDHLLNDKTVNFGTLVTALKRGAEDARVKGLVARAGGVQLGYGQIQELRDAIAAFRAKGKFAYVFAETFGEIGGGTRSYYLASAFDKIWLQPGGSLALVGIHAEIPFFKGTLDKVGVEAQFDRRAEYKSAATQFTNTKLPDTDRTAYESMLGSIYDEVTEGIGKERGMPADGVKQLVDGGPYLAQEAIDKHLIDKLGYRDALEQEARKTAGDGKLMDAAAYVAAVRVKDTANTVVAVIRAIGPIQSGAGNDGPFDNSKVVGADTMVRAFDEAIRDSQVKAIILRIDSPGGSSVASETIWRAVQKAREAKKPVIVSMGDTAASGGYYIAAGADKIVAEPATLTGSIGVFAGKFVLSGLWDKLGVSYDTLSFGRGADIESSLSGFTPEEKQHFTAMLDDTYKTFVAHVAEGRHLDPVKAEQLARGRVWTGQQAQERGLVDTLGGFDTAIDLGKQAAGVDAGTQVALRAFPLPRSTLERFLAGLDTGLTSQAEIGGLMERLNVLEPVLHRLDQLRAATSGGLGMAPVEIVD